MVMLEVEGFPLDENGEFNPQAAIEWLSILSDLKKCYYSPDINEIQQLLKNNRDKLLTFLEYYKRYPNLSDLSADVLLNRLKNILDWLKDRGDDREAKEDVLDEDILDMDFLKWLVIQLRNFFRNSALQEELAWVLEPYKAIAEVIVSWKHNEIYTRVIMILIEAVKNWEKSAIKGLITSDRAGGKERLQVEGAGTITREEIEDLINFINGNLSSSFNNSFELDDLLGWVSIINEIGDFGKATRDAKIAILSLALQRYFGEERKAA